MRDVILDRTKIRAVLKRDHSSPEAFTQFGLYLRLHGPTIPPEDRTDYFNRCTGLQSKVPSLRDGRNRRDWKFLACETPTNDSFWQVSWNFCTCTSRTPSRISIFQGDFSARIPTAIDDELIYHCYLGFMFTFILGRSVSFYIMADLKQRVIDWTKKFYISHKRCFIYDSW